MRLLADAHISRAMVAYLHGLGHEILHVATLSPRRLDIFKRFWPVIEQNAGGHFVVVTDTSVRRSPLPTVGE